MKNLVIIPTYNERENILNIVQGVLKNDGCEILFVDDNSPDKTAEAVKELGKKNINIKIIERSAKLGLGSAYQEGFKYAMAGGYSRIIMMDADLSHPPEKIKDMLVSNSDFVVGSRYVENGRITGWPWYRYLLSKFANLYASSVLNIGVSDLTSGFNCITGEVLQSINLNALKGEGYAFLIELKYSAFKKGFKLSEIPITFKEREKGVSKISKNIIFEAFWLVLALKLLK